jgi:hypothetical protein
MPAAACNLELERRGEGGRRVLANGGGDDARPLTEHCQLLIWAPLPPSPGAIAACGEDGAAGRTDLGSGIVANPLDFLLLARAPMRRARLLESEAGPPCCGSRLLVELSSDELTYRSVLHRPEPVPPAEVLRLEDAYPAREASAWAVCHWNSRALDPVEPAGILLLNQRHTENESRPSLYVLWRDVDGFARGWEAFGDVPDPRALALALDTHFRYVARDQELLVVDRSPLPRPGPEAALSSELVSSAALARPPLPPKTTG